jgi:hypothetical protein
VGSIPMASVEIADGIPKRQWGTSPDEPEDRIARHQNWSYLTLSVH